jgi:hypothetical protein
MATYKRMLRANPKVTILLAMVKRNDLTWSKFERTCSEPPRPETVTVACSCLTRSSHIQIQDLRGFRSDDPRDGAGGAVLFDGKRDENRAA